MLSEIYYIVLEVHHVKCSIFELFSLMTKKDLDMLQVLSDPEYNVAVHAVKLNRVVEMYQWQEHETER